MTQRSNSKINSQDGPRRPCQAYICLISDNGFEGLGIWKKKLQVRHGLITHMPGDFI